MFNLMLIWSTWCWHGRCDAASIRTNCEASLLGQSNSFRETRKKTLHLCSFINFGWFLFSFYRKLMQSNPAYRDAKGPMNFICYRWISVIANKEKKRRNERKGLKFYLCHLIKVKFLFTKFENFPMPWAMARLFLMSIQSFLVACTRLSPYVGWRGSFDWIGMKPSAVVEHDMEVLHTKFQLFPVVRLF